jgi:hypothetical protein
VRTVSLPLPAHARQGGHTWYVVRLRALFRTRPSGAEAVVSVALNTRTVLQIIVQREPGAAHPVIKELDLINGYHDAQMTGGATRIVESNYAQLGSVPAA